MRLFALIVKEWKLLLRDWHALLLLFAMPAAFILVMSLAMQSGFAAHEGVQVQYYLLNRDRGPAADALVAKLAAIKQFRLIEADAPQAALLDRVKNGRAQFLVVIPAGFGKAILQSKPQPVQMSAGPDVEPAVYQLFAAALRGALAHVYLQKLLAPLQTQMALAGDNGIDLDAADRLLQDRVLYQVHGQNLRPSSVQQSVPAWLLFAMFFIALPLSTTWLQERQQGTYTRLRSMGLGPGVLLSGKLVPYLGINLLQVVVMLAVGVYLVPWCGGDALTLGNAPGALCLITVAAGFASVAYGLLVANLVTTSEQATIFIGVANLLMAALGGIMVPSFLMPPVLQMLSRYSPMAWGLQGFLDVFLRQGGLTMVLPQAGLLFCFGLACLAASTLVISRRRGK